MRIVIVVETIMIVSIMVLVIMMLPITMKWINNNRSASEMVMRIVVMVITSVTMMIIFMPIGGCIFMRCMVGE